MPVRPITRFLPSWKNALLALLAAGLLILAFPDFEWWWTAWFALVPLMWAVEREKESVVKAFLVGWLFGTAFFFGTCWWLTYAPIYYAAVPWPIAYLLILIACLGAGVFPGIFAAVLSFLLRRFGSWAFLAAPFVWVFSEFLRYWVTGNNWNAIGYSQACEPFCNIQILWAFTPGIWTASIGGILLTTGVIVLTNVMFVRALYLLISRGEIVRKLKRIVAELGVFFALAVLTSFAHHVISAPAADTERVWSTVIAIQPNVPMKGLDPSNLRELRQRQFDLAESEINKVLDKRRQENERRLAEALALPTNIDDSITVVLPESPMNFMYSDDREFQQFVGDFARRNRVSVLFNSAEPDHGTTKYFNSAVMVGPDGMKVEQYDKVYLLPFGEAVPAIFENFVPAFVGTFAYGREYDLFPVGNSKAGVMICFESHFGQLAREYVRNGADVLIEMTNDGYLGPTPVLRQHFANAVARAVEAGRPVLRVTNVGMTAYINPKGDICDSLFWCSPEPYTEGVLTFGAPKSDGSQTFYVKYGDWFAWLCTVVTLAMCGYAIFRRRQQEI